jgi:hypothetical protein
MPLAPRSEPIGGRLRRRSSSAGAGEAAGAEAEEGEGEEEEGEDGALPQVLPQEDPGPPARDLRARLRYNALAPRSSCFVRVWDSRGCFVFRGGFSGFRLFWGVRILVVCSFVGSLIELEFGAFGSRIADSKQASFSRF